MLVPAKAQNGLPSINNLKATKIQDSTKVQINYNLVDQNSPQIQTSLKISQDSGRTYNDYSNYAKSNLGSNISPGSNKSLILDYPDSVQNILNYQIKLEAYDVDSVNIQKLLIR